MRKWEYKIAFIAGTDGMITRRLNGYGREGWELVCVDFIWWYYFKREIREHRNKQDYL